MRSEGSQECPEQAIEKATAPSCWLGVQGKSLSLFSIAITEFLRLGNL
jgi:hypothetical protein